MECEASGDEEREKGGRKDAIFALSMVSSWLINILSLLWSAYFRSINVLQYYAHTCGRMPPSEYWLTYRSTLFGEVVRASTSSLRTVALKGWDIARMPRG